VTGQPSFANNGIVPGPGESMVSGHGLSCSDGQDIHADDSVSPGGPLLGRSGETIESRHDVRIVEPRRTKHLDELCFQQSACDSTRPEVDVTKRAVGQDFPNDDVGDLRTPARLEHSGDLGDGLVLVRDEIQHAI